MIVQNYKARWIWQEARVLKHKPIVRNFGDQSDEEDNFDDYDVVYVAGPVVCSRFAQLTLLQLENSCLHVVAKDFITILNESPDLRKENYLRQFTKLKIVANLLSDF